jgi:translation initiation factor 3 subunit C
MHPQDPDAFEREYAATVAVSGPTSVKPPGGHGTSESKNEDAVDDFTTVGKGGKLMQFTADGIFKNLKMVQEARGRKVNYLNTSSIVC